jgi:hypothetical protein
MRATASDCQSPVASDEAVILRPLYLGGETAPAPPDPVMSPAIPDSDMTPLAEIIIDSADSNGSEGG